MRIDHISIQCLCHATESEEKVLSGLKQLYPSFEKRTAKGYFGNPIFIFSAHLTRKKEIEKTLSVLTCLSPSIARDLERRVDRKGNIFIRLDKQELYGHNFILKDQGEVKITIHMRFYPQKGKDAMQYAKEVFSN
jgi:RNA binding exosome subunit